MTHPYIERLYDAVSEAGLCEGCPAINEPAAKITELIQEQETQASRSEAELRATYTGKMGPDRFIESVGKLVGLELGTFHEAEEAMRQEATERIITFHLAPLLNYSRRGVPCRGALRQDQVDKRDFLSASQEQAVSRTLAALYSEIPDLRPRASNKTAGGYYCELQHRDWMRKQVFLRHIVEHSTDEGD